MASREELLQSIKPDMKLTWDFFKKIYGYEISFPGFAEVALKALEDAGSTHSRQHYEKFVNDYEQKKQEELYPVAVEYVKRLEAQWEKEERERIRGEKLSEKKQSLQNLSDSELLTLLQNLADSDLL